MTSPPCLLFSWFAAQNTSGPTQSLWLTGPSPNRWRVLLAAGSLDWQNSTPAPVGEAAPDNEPDMAKSQLGLGQTWWDGKKKVADWRWRCPAWREIQDEGNDDKILEMTVNIYLTPSALAGYIRDSNAAGSPLLRSETLNLELRRAAETERIVILSGPGLGVVSPTASKYTLNFRTEGM